MDPNRTINIFDSYKQENSFINGLFSLRQLSVHENPRFVASFMAKLLNSKSHGRVDYRLNVRVLKGIDFADAELRSGHGCFRFETKIRSGDLSHDQVRRRLRELSKCPGRMKRVVLLTPDDGNSSYVKSFISKYNPRVIHLEWRQVYAFLQRFVDRTSGVFAELTKQFLKQIEETVFEQDFAGVITKIAFNEHTGVGETTYLQELRRNEWVSWSTPRPYKELDGTGRRLLLYHRGRGITAEIEIKNVENDYRKRFPSANIFAARPRVFKEPISLKSIRSISCFENFGEHRKDRSPYRNVTRRQYQELMSALQKSILQ